MLQPHRHGDSDWKTKHAPQQKRSRPLTFVAVSHCVEVHVVLLVGEEEEAEPGVEGVDGDDEEDPDYVPLFIGRTVVTQVHVDLQRTEGEEEEADH